MKRAFWPPAEDAVIVEIYTDGGAAAVLERLPHRTLDSVTRRASKLGVRRRSRYSHPKKVAKVLMSPVPAHDYTAEDYALRAWRYPVEPGQLRWAA